MADNISPKENWQNEDPAFNQRVRPTVYGVGKYGKGRYSPRDITRYLWEKQKPVILAFVLAFAAALAVFATDTYTPNLNLRKPDVDIEDTVTPWGTKINNNLDLIDTAYGTFGASTASFSARFNQVAVATTSLRADLDYETIVRTDRDNAIGVSTAALNTAKVAKAGDTMTGQLTMSGPSANIVSGASITASAFWGNGSNLTGVSGTDATKVLKSGDTMIGVLTVLGLSLQGIKTNAEIQALVCAAGIGACIASSSDEGDLYISTGTLAGQYRNARTGKGP